MKVAAAVGIFCLIVTVVNGATFSDDTVIKDADGNVIKCSTEWGGKTYTADIGEGVRLPSINDGYCVDCSCDESGMGCSDVYKESPGCPGIKFKSDGKGGFYAVGK